MPIRRVYFYLLLAIVIVAGGLGLRAFTDQQAADGNNIARVTQKGSSGSKSSGTPAIGGAYTLLDQNGKAVSHKTYQGKYVLIFFGYTFCPDVCPTTLTVFSSVMDLLGKDAAKVQPIFVTVDPERDTPEHLKSYLTHFHKSFAGLTGSVQQIEHVKKVFRIYAAKTAQDEKDPEDYLMDHSSVSYLMGPDGKFLTFFSYGLEAEAIATKLKEFL
ncbi:MAG: SCO family protein [Rhodospirillaceae bacterium]|jgi:cytochrome oxidase Cu insertion factor (SCO1/SenC/PrrC family)|nr:SCO family protein [Rhodospirillaceae bacterium]MBT4588369.1 SCO family protein [Rhodospirillaceae bacterium]MBT4940214.1 SCO family protein [Rhodospirillaceae bacterium]MBT5938908.1 SCO family protein [Rhodospirillaceae bacterium]MBT7266074.1 SCO family protein [Rhodospirillaceae bacterium]